MNTMATTGPIDPPQPNTNVVGIKRIRKKLQLVAGNGVLQATDIITCLPLTGASIRILKFSAWGSATAGSFISVLFGNAASGSDTQTWTDEGTQGSIRPQIHLTPNFNYRNTWITTGPVASVSGTATDLIVIDVTVEYRTAVQSCPAFYSMEHALVCSTCLVVDRPDCQERTQADEGL
jgi:hypothetical protein